MQDNEIDNSKENFTAQYSFPDKDVQADNPKNRPKFTFEERQRLLGFFSILLKVDKRVNPDYYKPKQDIHHESNTTGESVG